jgi:hypothetical protein
MNAERAALPLFSTAFGPLSVVSRHALQAGGRRFDPVTAHRSSKPFVGSPRARLAGLMVREMVTGNGPARPEVHCYSPRGSSTIGKSMPWIARQPSSKSPRPGDHASRREGSQWQAFGARLRDPARHR